MTDFDIENQRILVLLNPNAGSKKRRISEEIIKAKTPNALNLTFRHTAYVGHAKDIVAKEKQHYDVFVAVGGDGTINEIASELVYEPSKYLMLIPNGSGNGLANELGIKKPLNKIFSRFTSGQVRAIDAFQLNDTWSFNISGLGFDARVAHLFAKSKTRGLWNYVRLGIKHYLRYDVVPIELAYGDQKISLSPFILCIANSKQYGNNFEVANKAKLDSGSLEVVCLNAVPIWYLPYLFLKVYQKRLEESKFIVRYKLKTFTISSKKPIEMHVDGEPKFFENCIQGKVHPRALQVIV